MNNEGNDENTHMTKSKARVIHERIRGNRSATSRIDL
jgi:hypothetical protein